MFDIQFMTQLHREGVRLRVEQAGKPKKLSVKEGKRLPERPEFSETRIGRWWHVLSQLRKVRIEVTFDLNPPCPEEAPRRA